MVVFMYAIMKIFHHPMTRLILLSFCEEFRVFVQAIELFSKLYMNGFYKLSCFSSSTKQR